MLYAIISLLASYKNLATQQMTSKHYVIAERFCIYRALCS